ncbi:Alpha-1,2-mannosyltransferase MNN23 [Cyphellophora attinorum]|uniref:Alpha-1,2-mannosyltransferase MNN23 n=1 Tax=Cyphellophora attinorum TaxID=1664694 RepID=A0A0N0NHX5_9EURO|nr:Alpha-1,2-mannosyltransferase MNN23 [Phialophora attinorum]KPI35181.1 Alpha-1,2-mannosyltransferase MNN23 [Phialophora attinorum]
MASIGARATRRMLAGAVLALIFLSLWYIDTPGTSVTVEGQSGSQNPLMHNENDSDNINDNDDDNNDDDDNKNDGHEKWSHIPSHLHGKTHDLTKLPPQILHLHSDLHHLHNNDEFLPYIAGISSVPNLTVSTAYGTCKFTDEEMGSFVYNNDAPWVLEPTADDQIVSLREAWQSYVKRGLIPWEAVKDRYSGKGIVIVGGKGADVKRIVVALRALQKHGSKLPVEINYFDDELVDTTRQALTDIYGDKLLFNDLAAEDQPWATFKVFKDNYQLKTAALVNSRFSEMLLLDSDNIPTRDPATLFESKAYKEFGSVFWPDFPRTRKEHPAWAAFNTPCRRGEYEFETGQALIDKRRHFYHLQFAAWMNTQPYWREMLLGDKDLFRYAWHALKTDFGTPFKWLTSIGFYAEQQDGEGSKLAYCGHTFGQSFPDHDKDSAGSGIAFLHGGALKTVGGPLLARLRKLKGGIFTHFKRVKVETLEDWSQVEYGVTLEHWRAGWYYNFTKEIKAADLLSPSDDFDLDGKPMGEAGLQAMELGEADMNKVVLCTDFAFVEPRPIAELGEDATKFEQLYEDIGGYWAIEFGYHGW